MNISDILSFLDDLSQNNNRDWFDKNRTRYEAARDQMRETVATIIDGIRTFDPSIGAIEAKDAVFRIFRDVRFSKDKSPYKTHMGAFIAQGGRKSAYPGYYIHLDPKGSFVGGGVYRPEAKVLKSIRYEILDHYQEFLGLITAPSFKKRFGTITHMDDVLKRPPKDFPPDFKGMEYLKFKSFVSGHNLPDRKWNNKDFTAYVLEAFRDMADLNHFLARAVDHA